MFYIDDIAVSQIRGSREEQEDDYGLFRPTVRFGGSSALLAVVCDGMGGEAGGREASHAAVRGFIDTFAGSQQPTLKRLVRALDLANMAVGLHAQRHPQLAGMGSTLVAVHVEGKRLTWLSVGDSLIWLYRNRHIKRLNRDHNLGQELDAAASRGELSPEAAQSHPDRNLITSAVMGEPIEEIDRGAIDLRPGDLVLLASDGVLTLDQETLGKVIAKKYREGPESIAQTVMHEIERRAAPRQDNATLQILAPRLSAGSRLTGFLRYNGAWLLIALLTLILLGVGGRFAQLYLSASQQGNSPVENTKTEAPTEQKLKQTTSPDTTPGATPTPTLLTPKGEDANPPNQADQGDPK